MTEEARTPIDADETRRARLAARRRRNTRLAIAGLALVLVAAVVAVGAYTFGSDESSAKPASPNNADAEQSARTALPEVAAAKRKAVRTLSHAAPLRVWVGGDSLAGAFGPPLGDLLADTGVVQTRIDYKVSSGLWGNDVRNWEERAAEQMTSSDPEVVVFMIGTNDTSAVNRVDANGDGIDDWEVSYRAKVDRMMDLFVGAPHRSVFFLGAPTLGTASADAAAVRLDQVFKDEAAKRKPDVVYVDTYRLFSGPNGGFSHDILDENGNDIYARIGDGVHFTPKGADYLAHAVFTLIDARWNITKQADPKQPISWTLAEGSGEQVPGYSYRPRPHYYNPTPVVTPPPAEITTPPATTAPATTPPASEPPGTTPPTTKTPPVSSHTTPTT